MYRGNNADTNIPMAMAVNDHLSRVKCFFFCKLTPNTNANHKKLSIILCTRRKKPLYCIDISSWVIDFNCSRLILSDVCY